MVNSALEERLPYISEAPIAEGSGAKPRLVMSEKLKTQRAWTTIQNKTTRDYEQPRIIHSGAVNDRKNYICRYVHSRSTRHITHGFTQHDPPARSALCRQARIAKRCRVSTRRTKAKDVTDEAREVMPDGEVHRCAPL